MLETAKSKVIALSPLDEERFGVKSARTTTITANDIPQVLQFCRDNGVVFLVARCYTGDFEAVHRMEQNGFKLMDTLVYYSQDITKTALPVLTGNVKVSPLVAGEEKEVEEIAARAFQNYFGHYHADPRLDKHKADEVYSSWTMRCCTSREAADVVLVAKNEGKIAGLLALKLSPEREGNGLILCVDPSVQGLKISSNLMVGGLEWCRANGATKMKISTQLINTKVQRVWTRLGFELSETFYTFHKWFDE